MNKNKQQGLSFWGWLATLFALGCFVMIFFLLMPVYSENYTVKDVLRKISPTEVLGKNKRQIRALISSRLNINNVRDFPEKEAILLTVKRGIVKINLKYERRVPIIYNVDAVVSFDKKYTYE